MKQRRRTIPHRKLIRLAGLALIFGSGEFVVADTINVPGDFATIQAAIDAAVSGVDEIVVAPGTYNEVIDLLGKAITLRSSSEAAVTTIDGTGLNDSVVKCISGEGSDTVLDGFTITGGSAWAGGGMYNFNSPGPTISNCDFRNNDASQGGGMYNAVSSPTVTNCTFTSNSSSGAGGGMYNHLSSPTVTNCTFSGNSASLDGGGMYNFQGSPTATNCTFTSNSAYRGGGMYNSVSGPTVTNCTFADNSAGFAGGIFTSSGDPTITNCTFSRNSADNSGGGMSFASGGSPTVTNCMFNGNSGGSSGGGLMIDSAVSPIVTNCTFSGNSAAVGGGVLNGASSSHEIMTFTNCVLWGNSPDSFNSGGTGVLVVTYCNVEGGFTGTGNINLDPLFVDPLGSDGIPGTDDDDLRLSTGSPCIDSGNNAALPPEITTDIDGNPRFVDDPDTDDCPQPGADCGTPPIVDMGAYEFQGSGETIPTVSEWGLIVMSLLLLTVGTVVLRGRPTATG